MQLVKYDDPGHGWLAVPLDVLKLHQFRVASQEEHWPYGGDAPTISTYSYVKNDYAFLEEDADMSTFLQVMELKGIDVSIDVQYQDPTPIRNYRSIRASDLKGK